MAAIASSVVCPTASFLIKKQARKKPEVLPRASTRSYGPKECLHRQCVAQLGYDLRLKVTSVGATSLAPPHDAYSSRPSPITRPLAAASCSISRAFDSSSAHSGLSGLSSNLFSAALGLDICSTASLAKGSRPRQQTRPRASGSSSRGGEEYQQQQGSDKTANASRPSKGKRAGPSEPSLPLWALTGFAAVGAVETAYLTVEKLIGGSVACPTGGCQNVLDSPWGTLLGLPLPLYGFVAYSAVALLSQLTSFYAKGPTPVEDYTKWLLLAATTGMASVSGYLVYVLNTDLAGTPCVFCTSSAALSAILFLLTLTGFTGKELQQAAAPQLGLAAAVVVSLATINSDASTMEIDLPPIEPLVTTMSDPPSVALAKHLRAVGAKMYGAFWCSHCYEQKQMFGREAMADVDYVECYPEGYRRGVVMAAECDAAKVEGFPTWIIKGQAVSGEQSLEDLAAVSGFDLEKGTALPAPRAS